MLVHIYDILHNALFITIMMLCNAPELWLVLLRVWLGRASQLRDLRARLQEAWAANLQQLQHIEATLHPPAQRATEEGDGVEEGQGSAPRITIPPTGSAHHLVIHGHLP